MLTWETAFNEIIKQRISIPILQPLKFMCYFTNNKAAAKKSCKKFTTSGEFIQGTMKKGCLMGQPPNEEPKALLAKIDPV
jgi:hypothetical protein